MTDNGLVSSGVQFDDLRSRPLYSRAVRPNVAYVGAAALAAADLSALKMTTSSSSDSSTETELPLSQEEDVSFLAGQLSTEDLQLIKNVDLSKLREDGSLRDLTEWQSWYRENVPAQNADVAAAAGGGVRRGAGQVEAVLTPPPTPQDQLNARAPGGSQKNQVGFPVTLSSRQGAQSAAHFLSQSEGQGGWGCGEAGDRSFYRWDCFGEARGETRSP